MCNRSRSTLVHFSLLAALLALWNGCSEGSSPTASAGAGGGAGETSDDAAGRGGRDRDAGDALGSQGPAGSSGAGLRDAGSLDGATSNASECVPPERRALFVLLDSSTSNDESATSGVTKWQATALGFEAFLDATNERSASVGLQFFPLLKPGSSYFCTSHDDCGPEGGLCYLQTCSQGEEIVLCRRDADCPGIDNSCVPFGLCEATREDPRPLACLLGPGSRCQDDLGACVDFDRTCESPIDCSTAVYANPAVAFAPIRENGEELRQELAGRAAQGLTPGVPALEGALDYVLQWADTHPSHRVSVALVSDGTSTVCGSDSPSTDRDTMSALAASALEDSGVRTFAISTATPDDEFGTNIMRSIAEAGGTAEDFQISAGSGGAERVFRALMRAAGYTPEGAELCVSPASP